MYPGDFEKKLKSVPNIILDNEKGCIFFPLHLHSAICFCNAFLMYSRDLVFSILPLVRITFVQISDGSENRLCMSQALVHTRLADLPLTITSDKIQE